MDILFLEIDQTGIIKLNRPKALNALNLEMAKKFYDKLLEWEENNNISRVILYGEGKHFCAGGDVKSLVLAGKKNHLKYDFFKIEYQLNYLISQFSKEFLSIWHGVVMGGGVGLSIYGDHRLVTDNSKFAMPEAALGFFPDVGGSYFLSNLPGNIGKYVGLTGDLLNVNELIFFGLATHYVNLNDIEDVKKNFINNGKILSDDYEVKNDTNIIRNIDQINELFDGNIKKIIANLKNNNSEYSKKILDVLSNKCPMSLAITTKLIDDAKGRSLKECLEIEFQLSQNIVYRDDFDNGVTSLLISKDHNPIWQPSNIDDINIDELNNYFESDTESLYL
ncbi:enoyl-CoA hydratase/isomerase family protein [Pelagibacteraceae bacterium]|nr:enoyl-CoA hydratase/isomerase family protein [Pelagibacteraceae bacterium]